MRACVSVCHPASNPPLLQARTQTLSPPLFPLVTAAAAAAAFLPAVRFRSADFVTHQPATPPPSPSPAASDCRPATVAMGCGSSSASIPERDIVAIPTRPQRYYTAKDVSKHASPSDLWSILFGNVYDLTAFSESHPGGEELITQYAAGKDCTDLFIEEGTDAQPFAHRHSRSANNMLEPMKVGVLVGEGDPRAGRTLEEVEAEVEAAKPPINVYQGSPLRAQALHRIKQVEAAGGAGAGAGGRVSPSGSGGGGGGGGSGSRRGSGALAPVPPLVAVLQAFSMEEVAKHALQSNCWTIRHAQVYDVTPLVNPAAPASAAAAAAPQLDWRKIGGKDSTAYLASLTSGTGSSSGSGSGSSRSSGSGVLSEESLHLLLAPLQVGFLQGHSLQDPDLGRVAAGRGGSMLMAVPPPSNPRRNSASKSSAVIATTTATATTGTGSLRGSRAYQQQADIDSAAARVALNAIAGDVLTVAAAEGLLASPSSVRYLWRLSARRELTHDTVLLTFDPVVAAADIAAFQASLSDDDRELATKYPVTYATKPLRPAIAHHVSVEIPNQLPVENTSEHLQRERENRPLDVPFRMQRSYTPLDAGALLPRDAHMTLAVKSYPKVRAPGSAYMHGLEVGDTIVTTGARSRFDFEAMAAGGPSAAAAAADGTNPKGYDYWIAVSRNLQQRHNKRAQCRDTVEERSARWANVQYLIPLSSMCACLSLCVILALVLDRCWFGYRCGVRDHPRDVAANECCGAGGFDAQQGGTRGWRGGRGSRSGSSSSSRPCLVAFGLQHARRDSAWTQQSSSIYRGRSRQS